MRIAGDHRGIVDFVDLFQSDSHWYLVMEMASGGELFDRLINKGYVGSLARQTALGHIRIFRIVGIR